MFYEHFAKLCKDSGTSPCAVAKLAGMTQSNVTSWKNGCSPSLLSVGKLAKALGVPITALIPQEVEEGKGEKP